MSDRREQLARALAALERRVSTAAAAAGRDRRELTVVAVSKTWPASDVVLLHGLGQHDFGENRDQEARGKAADVASLLRAVAAPGPLRWHFIGQLQRNKARSVASYASWVHSLDRPPLVPALSRGAQATGRELTVLVQVSLDDDPDPGRGGARPADVPALADAVATAPSLRLGGVMAVAPPHRPARPAFAMLRDLSQRLRRDHPAAGAISAGMSADLEDAIAEGATHLRLGTALFGTRARVP